MIRLLLTVLLVSWASVASAATFYVSVGGHGETSVADANSCATAQNILFPKRNLTGANGALNCLASGDTLLVRGGDYAEYISDSDSNHDVASGTASAYTRIAAYSGETVTLNPTSTAAGIIIWFGYNGVSQYIELDGINTDGRPSSLADGHGSTPFAASCDGTGSGRQANFITFKNAILHNEVIGGYSPYDSPQAVSPQRSTPGAFPSNGCPGGHRFQRLTIYGGGFLNPTSPDYQGGYAFYVIAHNVLIEDCEIIDTRRLGMQVYNGGGSPVEGTIIRNNKWHSLTRGAYTNYSGSATAILIGTGATNTQVYNNIIYDIGNTSTSDSQGLYVWDGAVNTLAYHNTVYGVKGYGIDKSVNGGTLTLTNNLSYLSTVQNFRDGSPGQTTAANNSFIGTDPLFVSPSTGDFHLGLGSPVIDVVACLGSVPTDFEGTTRPQGITCDIGADEYLASGTLPGLVSCTPANGATGVDLFPSLICSSSGATSFDVYFGQPGNTDTPLFSSTFTAANSADIGADFTPYASVGITNATLLNNRVRSINNAQYSVEALTSVTLQADQWCRVQVVALANTSNNIANCLLRGSTPPTPNGYLVGISAVNQTGSWIARMTNGQVDAYLAIDSVTVWAANDRVQATAIGNTIRLYRYPSTTPILTVTDATYAAGRVGLVVFSATVGAVELDNFEAGNLGLPFIGNQASGTYVASNLAPASMYQYQFIAKNSVGDTPGPLNGFTTLGSTATPVGIRVRFKAP